MFLLLGQFFFEDNQMSKLLGRNTFAKSADPDHNASKDQFDHGVGTICKPPKHWPNLRDSNACSEFLNLVFLFEPTYLLIVCF